MTTLPAALILSDVGLPVIATPVAGVNVVPEEVQASLVGAPELAPLPDGAVGVPSLPQAARPSASVTAAAAAAIRVIRMMVAIPFQWVRIFDRKSLARSVRGLAKKVSGSASSTSWPSAMNTTRFAACR